MSNQGDGDLPQASTPTTGSSSAHAMYVGMLLVVIIGLLAVLWSRERRIRVAAEQNVANLKHENQTLRKALGSIGAFQTPATQPEEHN
jgi:hypothetical protein